MAELRKIAREAVIFMLAGFVLAAILAFVLLYRSELDRKRYRAAEAVFALEVTNSPDTRRKNGVLVPLTNGRKLSVTDCSQTHQIDFDKYASPQIPLPPGAKISPVPAAAISAGSTNGSDCVYFSSEYDLTDLGGRLESVPLGDANQIAIEKMYWDAYSSTRTDYVVLIFSSLVFSLIGLAGGLLIWAFYRLVRFAVTG